MYKIYEKTGICKEGYFKVYFEKDSIEAVLLINPVFSDLTSVYEEPTYHAHLEFYATSSGWQEFTETGFRSTFFTHASPDGLLDEQVVTDIFLEQLENSGFKFAEQIQEAFCF